MSYVLNICHRLQYSLIAKYYIVTEHMNFVHKLIKNSAYSADLHSDYLYAEQIFIHLCYQRCKRLIYNYTDLRSMLQVIYKIGVDIVKLGVSIQE